MNNKIKIAVSALTLTGAGLINLVVGEQYVGEAMIPTKGDRPTVGFGSTFHPDGRPVKLGEKTTPVNALLMAQAHLAKEEKIFRDSLLGAFLSLPEFDLYMEWVYQFGTGAWMISPMRRDILAGNHVKACQGLLDYRYMTSVVHIDGWEPYRWDAAKKPTRWRFDCSTPGNKQCRGVWIRSQRHHTNCLAAQ